MKLYLVTQEGVYRHCILGVYDTVEKAMERVKDITQHDDGYHHYVVNEAILNESCSDVTPIWGARYIKKMWHYEKEIE